MLKSRLEIIEIKQDIRNAVIECKSQGLMNIDIDDVANELENNYDDEVAKRYKAFDKKGFKNIFSSMVDELQKMVNNDAESGETCEIIKPKTSHKEKEIER